MTMKSYLHFFRFLLNELERFESSRGYLCMTANTILRSLPRN